MGKAKKIPYTQEELRELLDYDPDSGELRWRERNPESFKRYRSYLMWHARFCGQPAGKVIRSPAGYRRRKITINGKQYLYHRVVWLWMTGEQPTFDIDHINQNALDNRWENLRVGTGVNDSNHSMNKRNTSGYNGVNWHPSANKWRARVTHNKITYELGLYKDKELAAKHVNFFRRFLGGDPNHGKVLREEHYKTQEK